MAFVKTNRFPLPTVSRADGTLGAYVQASPPTSGPNFIWPADRVAIYQAQLKAAAAAQKKNKLFSFFNFFGTSPDPAPPTIRKKAPAVRTSARRLKGLGDDQGGPLVIPGDSVIAPDGTATLPNGTVINPQGQVTKTGADVMSVLQSAANLLASKKQPQQQQQPSTSPVAGISASTLGIGAAAFAALVVGLAAGGRRR